MKAEILVDCRNTLGEGPVYHAAEAALYWVDIDEGKLYRLAAGETVPTVFEVGQKIGGFTIQDDGSLILFCDAARLLTYRGGQMTTVIDDLPNEEGFRFNDVAADPEGRVFCGTIGLGIGLGRLYRLDTDGSIRVVLDGIGCSNGIAWTPDLSQMYYTDSSAGTIWLFDYDRPTGEISNQRVFKKFGEAEGGAPDGLTVDAEGNVWSAVWGGGCVICLAPDGTEIHRIHTTSPATTCPTFGGPELKDLYITSSRHAENSPEEAGALYHVRPGVTGRPEFLSRVRFSK